MGCCHHPDLDRVKLDATPYLEACERPTEIPRRNEDLAGLEVAWEGYFERCSAKLEMIKCLLDGNKKCGSDKGD